MGGVPEALADELDELAELASAMSADDLALATLLADCMREVQRL